MDLKQYSTQSGLIKLVFAIMGFAGMWFEKDISQIVLLYGLVSGAHGVTSKE
jgi:hypothetical protein